MMQLPISVGSFLRNLTKKPSCSQERWNEKIAAIEEMYQGVIILPASACDEVFISHLNLGKTVAFEKNDRKLPCLNKMNDEGLPIDEIRYLKVEEVKGFVLMHDPILRQKARTDPAELSQRNILNYLARSGISADPSSSKPA